MISYDLRQLLLITTYKEENGWFKISQAQARSKNKIRRIILVDDEPDIAVTIETVLEESGFFQVDSFNDAASALSLFRPDVYDLAILDIKMPEMNGLELCRRIKNIDNKIKICFLTAADLSYYRETDSDVINDLGTDCFISKPVDNSDITERLKSVLSIWRSSITKLVDSQRRNTKRWYLMQQKQC
jgi:two-component system response regulator ChvI